MAVGFIGAPPGRTGASLRHRWPTVALVVLALVASMVAVVNYWAAVGWRDRAISAERQSARATADADDARQAAATARRDTNAARRRRRALAGQLALSEADVAALEARLIARASDRARAEDLGRTARPASPDALTRSLRAQIDSCVAQVDAARAGLSDGTDIAAWQRALTAARASCEQIAADVDVLAVGG